MSKKKSLKKLMLGKDTIRALGKQALDQAAGGALPHTGMSCGNTVCCTRALHCGDA